MKIIADLHTHTNVSQHAYSSLDEMISGAREKSFYAIAITDHGPKLPDGAKEVHFTSMRHLPKNIKDVILYKGAEVNIVDYNGSLDLPTNILNSLDFVIASYHAECIEPSNIKDHTRGWINVIKNTHVDCLGHIGNPKFICDIENIVKECKNNNKIIEINSASFTIRTGSEPICKEVAELCKKYGLNIVVTSDAHSKYNVGEHTDALRMLESIDFPEELVINSSINKLTEYFNNKI